jgi:sugar lactone lactonase YvrE
LFVSHITGALYEVAGGKARPIIESGFQWPMGLAVDENGTVFVADGMFAYSIVPGQPRQSIGSLFGGNFPGFLRGLAVAGGGELLATTANGVAARWTPGSEPEYIAQGFPRLMGIAPSAGGGAVFADYETGQVMLTEGGEVSELVSGLDKPMGVAVASDGSVFAAESGKGRVVKISVGKAQAVIDGLGQPEGIAIGGGKLYVLDTKTKQVIESDLSGGGQRTIASNLAVGAPAGVVPKALGGVGDMCGPMTSMAGIAVGADGTIVLSADAEGSVVALRPGD